MTNHTDEIDLIDLLGVLIKRRSFIIWFIVLFTFVITSAIIVKEYVRTSGSKKVYTAELAVSVTKDPVYASYSYFKKTNDLDGYKKALTSVLMPSGTESINFELQLNGSGGVDYFFDKKDELDLFVKRYTSLMDSMNGLYSNYIAMKPETFASCRQLYVSRASNISVKDLFNTPDELKYCNLFNYYFNIVQGKFIYSIENLKADESYVAFITDYIASNQKDFRLVSSDSLENRDVKLELKHHFNKKKVVKYSVLVFILSVMLAFTATYIIEFWSNNKTRLRKYWKN